MVAGMLVFEFGLPVLTPFAIRTWYFVNFMHPEWNFRVCL